LGSYALLLLLLLILSSTVLDNYVIQGLIRIFRTFFGTVTYREGSVALPRFLLAVDCKVLGRGPDEVETEDGSPNLGG
jgi:uncharacterized PurR-regulated membrane protein YhhQ (DUF165 family)